MQQQPCICPFACSFQYFPPPIFLSPVTSAAWRGPPGTLRELKPGETARFDFKPDDMNDVLKFPPFTVTDRNGGSERRAPIPAIPWRSACRFPVGRRRLARRVSRSNEGERARFNWKRRRRCRSGVIISARVVDQSDKDRPSQHEVLVLLMDSGDIRSFDLRRQRRQTERSQTAKPASRLPDGAQPVARPRPPQRLHRCRKHHRAPIDRELYDARARLEIQLPPHVRRRRRAHPRRLGHYRQHLRRRLDQRAPGRGFRQARVLSSPDFTSPATSSAPSPNWPRI